MKTISITCHKCGKSINKSKKEYDRQIRNGRQYFYCSLSCSAIEHHTIHHNVISKCLWCNKDFDTNTKSHAKKCCSIDCARKYARSKLNADVHKKSVQRPSTFPQIKCFICIVCKNDFECEVKNDVSIKNTCSSKCYSILRSKISRENPNCGGKLGYRRFPYKGFTMDSRWEVEIAKWMDEKGIKWDRSRKRHMFQWVDNDGDTRKYFPDFYLPDLDIYLDPKNDYYLDRDMPKLKQVIDTYGITLFYGQVETIKQNILSVLT
jgi:hypothetical protein